MQRFSYFAHGNCGPRRIAAPGCEANLHSRQKVRHMHRNALRSAIVAVAFMPMAAMAAGPTYNYIDAAYLSIDVDDGPTFDGFGVGGSFALTESFHVVGSYADVSKGPMSATTSAVSLGYNHSLNDITDLVARAGWVHGRAKISGFGSESDNGWSVEAGLRAMLSPQFELNGFITYVDLFDDDDTSLSVGGVYYLTHNIGLGAGVSFSDDATGWQVGFRFAF
jgi:hypothetical protein